MMAFLLHISESGRLERQQLLKAAVKTWPIDIQLRAEFDIQSGL
jgi:hypothetical protein